jgi:hypothetical protein
MKVSHNTTGLVNSNLRGFSPALDSILPPRQILEDKRECVEAFEMAAANVNRMLWPRSGFGPRDPETAWRRGKVVEQVLTVFGWAAPYPNPTFH